MAFIGAPTDIPYQGTDTNEKGISNTSFDLPIPTGKGTSTQTSSFIAPYVPTVQDATMNQATMAQAPTMTQAQMAQAPELKQAQMAQAPELKQAQMTQAQMDANAGQDMQKAAAASYGGSATEALKKGMAASNDYASDQASRSAMGAGTQAVGYARSAGLSPAQAALMAGQQSGTNYNSAYQNAASEGLNQYGQLASQMGNLGTTQQGLANQKYATDVGQNTAKYGADVGQNTSQYQSQLAANTAKYGADVGQNTSQYQSQLAANTAKYGADVGQNTSQYQSQLAANTAKYGTDVGANTAKYGTDVGKNVAQTNAQAGYTVAQQQNALNRYATDTNAATSRYASDKGLQGAQTQSNAQQQNGIMGMIGAGISGIATLFSDENAKADIKDGYGILSAVTKNVNPKTFNYKKDTGQDPLVRHAGIMAQDLEKTPLAGAVSTDPTTGYKKVDTNQLTAGNTAMIAELSKKVDSLAKYFKAAS
jgi:hypothetical protein